MTSSMLVILAFICIALAVGLFFYSSYDGFVNYCIRKFWIQAEKCYLNFELMFMENKFTLTRCKLIVLASTGFGVLSAGYITWSAPQKVSLVLMAAGAVIGWILPGIVTSIMHKRYVDSFDEQLLDGISMLGSSLRSGLSLVQAMEMVANEMAKPISQEFRLLLNEYKYGIILDDAMDRMAKRIPSPDLWIVIESILILRNTGANLVETFDIIIHTIRERKKIEGKVKTMTSMGVAQAAILLSIPFVLMFVLHKLNPSYMTPLFTTTIGWAMLAVMIIIMSLGAFLIKKIVTIDV